MKMKKNDIMIFILIIVIALILLIIWNVLFSNKGSFIVVTKGKEQIGTYSLLQDGTYLIGDKEESYNLLVIKNGSAYIEEADCPDKLCVKQKKINARGETIVCLPHELVIQVVTGESPEIDAVSN